jgi:hypothetical protein
MSSNKAAKQSSQEVLAGVRERITESRAAEPAHIEARQEWAEAVKEVASKWR